MKKLTRVLSIVLSMIMVFSVIAVAAACPDEKGEPVKVTYVDGVQIMGTFEVESGKKIPDDKVAADPVPASDKVFLYWSEDGVTDFVAKSKPTKKETTLKSVYRDRTENEVVVTFNTDGAANEKTQVLKKGDKVAKPADPKRTDAEFDKWQEVSQSEAYNFDSEVYEDLRIQAFWIEGKNRTLILSTGNLDKVFSPFFATSAYDSEIAGSTQISMLASNGLGEPYVGEDTPTVVKSFTETILVNGVPDDGSKANLLSDSDRNNPNICRTEYEFVIKNGIRFSDGTPLTIKDVLFNLYVYLDPTFTGSATIYSTKILGLNAYRTQNPDAVEGGAENFTHAEALASQRLANLRQYFGFADDAFTQNRARIANNATEEENVYKDLQRLRVNLWRELWSEWNSCLAIENIEEDYAEYNFSKSWEVFLLNVGFITAEYDSNTGNIKKDTNGDPLINYGNSKSYFKDPKYLIPIVFNELLGVLNDDEKGNYIEASAATAGYPKVDIPMVSGTNDVDEAAAYTPQYLGELADKGTSKTTFIARASDNARVINTVGSNLTKILRYWSSGRNLTSYVNADARSTYLLGQAGIGATGLKVPNIKGIKAENNGENDVLKITVVGIDPKAIWNFGFAVAPMHYYSNPDGKGYNSDYGYTQFKYPGVGGQSSEDLTYHLGFKQLDINYINNVINNGTVQALPVGAGAFMASNLGNSGNVTPTGFCDDNVVYFKRNTHFYTTGNDMNNARFEFLKYQVVDTSKIMDNLIGGSVHYGDPSATSENLSAAQNSSTLNSRLVENNGFGYVGVNAKYIPSIQIREAIMTALDTELITTTYYGGMAKPLTRTMSTVSWAYPENAKQMYQFVNESTALARIKELVKQSGYSSTGGLYEGAYHNTYANTGKVSLKYEFIVAGSTTDHPAFNMFQKAAILLNQCGFNVTVKNDAFALSKLSTGGLAVWAAAWGGGLDPDMYQVYHYKSTASSIMNWGFPEIMQSDFESEKALILSLAKDIEQGRQSTDRDIRASIYERALKTVMDLCIEYPTYQRDNLIVYDKTKIDPTSLNQNPTAYTGLLSTIWKIKLLK